MIRSSSIGPVCGLLLVAAACIYSSSLGIQPKPESPGESMTQAAQSFIKTLGEKEKSVALYKFDAQERTGWHFIPKDSRKGLQVKVMNKQQRAEATKLLRSCLSQAGFKKATTIMELEGLLHAVEKGRGNIRDTERYYYTIFGEPSENGKWGLSIEGHHLSLNFVVENNKLISVSPSFFAANPAVVKTDIYDKIKKGTRVLADEELLGFKLVNSLDDQQKKAAIFAEKAPKEIRAAGEAQPPTEAAIGIEAKKLTSRQLEILKRLVSAYSTNFPASIEKEKLDAIEKNGWEQVKFAWGGSLKPGVGHYYRIQGKSFLIEFVNTQPDALGNPANHIHCVWRNPNGDFAIELVK